MINNDDDDERLTDNECYANGNPPGRLLPSKHGDEITIPWRALCIQRNTENTKSNMSTIHENTKHKLRDVYETLHSD